MMIPRPPAVRATRLRKRYGDVHALDGVDLEVAAGTVHSLLGPNGAGKTTTVRALTTLLQLDEGHAEVAGFDVRREPHQVRARIGLTGQHAAVDEVLSGRQNLTLFGRLYHLDRTTARRRADELLERFGLTEAGNRPVRTYSGGMRRRLDLAAGLVLAPQVLFLDEPTTGLDPASRMDVWDAVRELVGSGTTVLLTTQYLEEADQLADRVSVIDLGRVIAEGTPDELKAQIGGDHLDITLPPGQAIEVAVSTLAAATGASPELDAGARRVSVAVDDRVAAVSSALRELERAGVELDDLALRRPTLDDVFLHLTGRRADTGATDHTGAPDATKATDEQQTDRDLDEVRA